MLTPVLHHGRDWQWWLRGCSSDGLGFCGNSLSLLAVGRSYCQGLRFTKPVLMLFLL